MSYAPVRFSIARAYAILVHIAAHEQVAGQRLGCRMVDHLVDAQLDPAPMDSPTKPAADGSDRRGACERMACLLGEDHPPRALDERAVRA
jgi:hypothetical protein